MTRTAPEGLGKTLLKTDEVVIEATGNAMAVSRVLSAFVARVVIANPMQVKAIAHAHVKTDKIDAGTPASLRAAGYLPEVWTPSARMSRCGSARPQALSRVRARVLSAISAAPAKGKAELPGIRVTFPPGMNRIDCGGEGEPLWASVTV